MQFVDIKNDVAFRKIFGNENKKIILISFLNAVMKLENDDIILDIDYLVTHQLPIIKNLKASILDIRARDKRGKSHIIEMQLTEKEGLDKRLLYYACKEYAQQIETGEQYTALKPVIFIGIFDFKFTKGDKYISHHVVCDIDNGERKLKDMDFYFIELPKFNKQITELEDIRDKWLFFLKEVKNLQVIPDNLDDEGLIAAYHDSYKHMWTKDELYAYDYAAMRDQDIRGELTFAEKKGIRTVAKNMIDKGMDVVEIMELTGLSKEDINELKIES
ncbi:MAG: Rpn family recombination-promoting nuclease/putative transposase [Saprospiraceae bacterium]